MNPARCIALSLALGSSLAAVPRAHGADEEADAVFKELFAPRIAAARKTASSQDDVDLAIDLVKSAESALEHPAVLKQLLAAAIDLGSSDPAGYAAAIDASRIWEKHFPKERIDAIERRILVRQKAYRAARLKERVVAGEALVDDRMTVARLQFDDLDPVEAAKHARSALSVAKSIRSDQQEQIGEFLGLITARMRVLNRIKLLKDHLEDKPKDQAAGRELILSYLLDLENPAEARKYTFLVQDPKLKAVVRNAGSSISELSAEDAAGMGDFYFELVKEPARRNQPELYEKALACYEQFLSLQPDAQDLEATRARIAVASIRDWLETHYRKSRALPMELKQGLVVHLGFDRDEEKGVRDLSGRGHHGRTAGGAWVRDGRGKGNGAYALDGKGAEIQLRPSALGQWKALTYSAWVKAPRQASSTWPAFIGNHTDGAGFNTTFGFYRGTGNLRLEVDTDQGNFIFKGTLTPPVNKWFHVAMVYDGKILREYVDGVPGASFTASGTLKKATTLSLGQEHPNWGSLLGQIDDAMIYNRALSAKHIKKIYELQRGSTRLRVSGGAMDRHLDRITPHLLMDRLENAEGREGINGWRKSAEGNAGLPVVLVNASAKDLLIPQTASAGSVMTHPPSAGGAGLAWRSPSTGTFRVQGRVTDVHACGNSVTWRIDALHGRGQTALGSGSVEPEGSSNFAAGASSRALGSVRLRAGEMLQLVVLPKGDYSCDMSRIDWVITELGGRGRVWNLAKDIVPDLHEKGHGNPHSDSYGNKDVWYFYEVPADQVPE